MVSPGLTEMELADEEPYIGKHPHERVTLHEICVCDRHGRLESFNGILKRKHLRRWQRGNRRLRVDVLVKLLVTKILPAIFDQRKLEAQEDDRWKRLLLTLPGGAALVSGLSSNAGRAVLPPVAYLIADVAREQAAADLLRENQISVPSFDNDTQSFLFTCYSAYATVYDPCPTLYTIGIATDGSGACNCPDFASRGGACKHLRAALLWLDNRRQTDPRTPLINMPSSESEARARKRTDLSARLQSHSNIPAAPRTLPTGAMRGIPAAVVDEAVREANEMLFEEGEDGEEEGGMEPREGVDDDDPYESDLESVATDAGDEEDVLFTALDHTGSARRGIEEQTFARVLFDLATVAPKLGQLGRYLKDSQGTFRTSEDAEAAARAKEEIDLLSEQLGRLLVRKDDPAGAVPHQGRATPEPQPVCNPTFATPRSFKHSVVQDAVQVSKGGGQGEAERMRLKRAALFPHSPEKDAKRRQSYGHD